MWQFQGKKADLGEWQERIGNVDVEPSTFFDGAGVSLSLDESVRRKLNESHKDPGCKFVKPPEPCKRMARGVAQSQAPAAL